MSIFKNMFSTDVNVVGFRYWEYDNYEQLNKRLLKRFDKSVTEKDRKRENSEYYLNRLMRAFRADIERKEIGRRTKPQQAFISAIPGEWGIVFRDKPENKHDIPSYLIPIDGIEFSPKDLAKFTGDIDYPNFLDAIRRLTYLCRVGSHTGIGRRGGESVSKLCIATAMGHQPLFYKAFSVEDFHRWNIEFPTRLLDDQHIKEASRHLAALISAGCKYEKQHLERGDDRKYNPCAGCSYRTCNWKYSCWYWDELMTLRKADRVKNSKKTIDKIDEGYQECHLPNSFKYRKRK